jgi:predicted dehydrogenase
MTISGKPKFRIGIVGYGVGKLHAWAYASIPHYYDRYDCDQIELVGVCTAHAEKAQAAVQHMGFRFYTTDYKELVERPDINVVSVAVPDHLHAAVATAAIQAGKHVYCEKPLAYSLVEAQEMTQAARAVGIVHQVGFQMRFAPAAAEAKKILDQGLLGDISTFRCTFLHSGYEDAKRAMSWRLDSTRAGGGALYDMGAHAIDLIRFLLGDFKRITARQGTFIKERPVAPGSEVKQPVHVDDVTFVLIEMQSGVIGSLEATRLATGLRRGPELTIHGSQGTLTFNGYTEPDLLQVYLKTPQKISGRAGFESLKVGAKLPIPVEVISQYDFLVNVECKKAGHPDFEDGLKVQEVLEATKTSAKTGQWVSLT